jgi:hypothetical protein
LQILLQSPFISSTIEKDNGGVDLKNQLYYTKPAKCFEQALPLGNGRLGIMTYGNLRHERLSLNEDSLWSGYPKNQNKADAHKYLAACREAIFAKDYAKAKDILNRDMHGHWSEAYLPLGNLRIDYDRAYKKNYSRTLDLHVQRLRRKLGWENNLVAVYKVGYRLEVVQ